MIMILQDVSEDTDMINIEVHVLTDTQLNLTDRYDPVYEHTWERRRHLDYRLDDTSYLIDRKVSSQDIASLYDASRDLVKKSKSILAPMHKNWNHYWSHLDIVLARGIREHPDFSDCAGCSGLYADCFRTGDEKKSPFSPLILIIVQEGSEDRIWPTLIHELAHFAWYAHSSDNKSFYDWVLQEGAGDHLVELYMGHQHTLNRGPAWEGTQWLEGLQELVHSVAAQENAQIYDFKKLPRHYKLGYQVVGKIMDQESCSLQDFICMSDDLRREAVKRLALVESP